MFRRKSKKKAASADVGAAAGEETTPIPTPPSPSLKPTLQAASESTLIPPAATESASNASKGNGKKGDLVRKLQALKAKIEGGSQPLDNATKRALYYEAERLWQQIKGDLPEDTAAELLAEIDQLETRMLQIEPAHLTKTPVRRVLQRLDMFIRIITCALYLCLLGVITYLPMITIVPLFDKLLRRLGWPRRYLIYEIAKKASARGFLLLAGVFYTMEGRQKEYATPALLLFQHGSNLDGFLILDSFPQFFKSIGKDDIFLMPYVGWMAYVYGILPIDRKHRNEAIKQLGRATRACQRGIAVALSPEGTRSKSGQLMRFKKGPFYVQADSKATITPLVTLGNYELWPPNYLFTCPGQVVMRYLPPITPSELPDEIGKNKDELSRYVRKQMFEAIDDIMSQPTKYQPGAPLTVWYKSINLLCICLFWLSATSFWKVVTATSDSFGFSRAALWGAFFVYSASITASLYILYCKAPVS